MGAAFLTFFKTFLLPEIPAIVAAIQGRGLVVTEAAILAELQSRGVLNTAQVDAWFAAHPPA